MTGTVHTVGASRKLPHAVEVPALRGVLSTDEDHLAAAARDFGNHIHRRPLAVLRPACAADVAAVVQLGRERGLAVVPRGAGHAVDGQAQAENGIVVDMATLGTVHSVAGGRVDVGAGARWSDVVDATLPQGLVPPVLPDHLGLSVGGTLSVGGLGGTSHRYGCVADTAHTLEVVTPTGEVVTCSRTQNADLFDAVRATQGHFGIITRAVLELTTARRTARRFLLGYRDLDVFLADQRRLTDSGPFGHVTGQARREGKGWRFVMEAVATFDAPGPDDRSLLDGLRYERGTEESRTLGFGQFLRRLAPLEASLRASGSWHHPHPRCNLLLPGRHATKFIAETLAGLGPHDLGTDGSVLLYPVPTARLTAPHMPRAQDATSVLFGVQRTAPPGDRAALARMRAANEALYARAIGIGGSPYCRAQ